MTPAQIQAARSALGGRSLISSLMPRLQRETDSGGRAGKLVGVWTPLPHTHTPSGGMRYFNATVYPISWVAVSLDRARLLFFFFFNAI